MADRRLKNYQIGVGLYQSLPPDLQEPAAFHGLLVLRGLLPETATLLKTWDVMNFDMHCWLYEDQSFDTIDETLYIPHRILEAKDLGING